MRDVKKSALWALISIPITLLLAGLGALTDTDHILGFVFLPAGIVGLTLEGLQGDLPEWVFHPATLGVIFFLTQYLCFFLLIYIFMKIVRLQQSGGTDPINK